MSTEAQVMQTFQETLLKLPPGQVYTATQELEREGKIVPELAQLIFSQVPAPDPQETAMIASISSTFASLGFGGGVEVADERGNKTPLMASQAEIDAFKQAAIALSELLTIVKD